VPPLGMGPIRYPRKTSFRQVMAEEFEIATAKRIKKLRSRLVLAFAWFRLRYPA
jgi:hypothetical protein